MIVLRENCSPPAGPVVATIGFFDGVHCGHRFLLSQTEDTARRRGGKSMAVTFSRHPSEVLCPGTLKELLTDFDERCSLLCEAGIDYCAVLDFTLALSKMSAKDFMSEYLRRRLNVSVLVVGYDHSFGHDKESTFDDYRKTGEQVGIEVIKAGQFIPPDGLKISSTQIRRQLHAGNVETAALMLGRRYALCGTVVDGRRVGRRIGFPTANISMTGSQKVIPAAGVYSAVAHVGENAYASVVNIGTRPTLHNGNDTTIEAHLIGFDGNIYGRVLELEFVGRLRDERRFDSLDELREQINRDAAAVVDILKNKA